MLAAKALGQTLHLTEKLPVRGRYMVILRHGGVYADIDTECGVALDQIFLPTDSFVAGWEDEYTTAEQAVDMRFSRQRQIEQWVFAAVPGHPILQV